MLTIDGHAGAVFGVAFAPDGSWLATAGADGTVRRWDAVTGQALWSREGHPGRVYGLAFSPDRSRLAIAYAVLVATLAFSLPGFSTQRHVNAKIVQKKYLWTRRAATGFAATMVWLAVQLAFWFP